MQQTDQPNLRALDILAEGTDDELRQLMILRKNIFRYFNEDHLIDRIKGIIDNSKSLDFSNKRVRKFINKSNPVFKLSLLLSELEDSTVSFIKDNNEDINNRTATVRDYIFKDLIDPFTSLMINAIESSDSTLLDRIPDDEVVKKFLFMNAFNIRIESLKELKPNATKVTLEVRYMI